MVKNIGMVVSLMTLGAFMSSEVEAGKDNKDLENTAQESKSKRRKKEVHTPLTVKSENVPGAPMKPVAGGISKATAGIRRVKRDLDFANAPGPENDPIWDDSVTERDE